MFASHFWVALQKAILAEHKKSGWRMRLPTTCQARKERTDKNVCPTTP